MWLWLEIENLVSSAGVDFKLWAKSSITEACKSRLNSLNFNLAESAELLPLGLDLTIADSSSHHSRIMDAGKVRTLTASIETVLSLRIQVKITGSSSAF
jgi:hypothetical protein